VDFSYTSDQEALRSLARQVLKDHATPERLERVEADPDRVDRTLWQALGRAGLLGVCIPETHGGSGLGFAEVCILLEEVGRTVAPVPVLSTLVLGALPVAEFGSAEQRARLLPGVAGGDTILTAALTEPNNRDVTAPVTRAVSEDGTWTLDGVKICVPTAADAATVLVPATTDAGVGMFLVDPRDPAVRLQRMEITTREVQYRMTLDSVRVPASDSLGPVAEGGQVLRWLVDRATVALCAMQVGVCEQALRMTAEHTSTRQQFDRPLAAFQAVAQRAADAYVDTEAIRLTTQAAISALSTGEPAHREIAVAKFWAADGGQRVVHAAQHLHGGVGVDLTFPLHRYFVWAKQIELTLGGATDQLLRLGAILAGEAA